MHYFPIPQDIQGPPDVGTPPRGGSDRGRGRGRGNLASKLRAGAPLSKVWYADRPLLRPIEFVRSLHSATLFQQEEEILQPVVEEVADNEQSHVPTAGQVTRVFSGHVDSGSDDGEEIEEIDFADIGKLQAAVDAAATNTKPSDGSAGLAAMEQKFTGFFIDTTPASVSGAIAHDFQGPILGEEIEDEEIIVYDAPNPRAGPRTPPPPQHAQVPELIQRTLQPTILSPFEGSSSVDPSPARELSRPEAPVPVLDAAQTDLVASEALPIGSNLTTFPTEIGDQGVVENVVAADQPRLEGTPIGLETELSTTDTQHPSSPPTASPILQPSEVPPTPTTNHDVPTLDGPMLLDEKIPILLQEEPIPSSSTQQEPKILPAPSFSDVRFGLISQASKAYVRKIHPVGTPRSLLRSRRPRKKGRNFAALGAMLSEVHLREEAGGKEVDPRRSEQRRGDSDVDWGDETSGEEEETEVTRGPRDRADVNSEVVPDSADGMVIDGDYDLGAMKSFVESMGAEGSRHMTLDDFADEEKMVKEELENNIEGGQSSSGDDDENEGGDGGTWEDTVDSDREEEDGDKESSHEEETAEGSFQARLRKIRSKEKGKARAVGAEDEDEDDMEMDLVEGWEQEGGDEELVATVQAFLDANSEILSSKDRKQQRAIFRSIRTGHWDLDEYETMMGSPAKRKRGKGIPPELQGQWEKDRKKKAENKQKRALERQRIASDPTMSKKGRKKALKARLRASRDDEDDDDDDEIPGQTPDIVSLEREIRNFLANISSHSLELPPFNKTTRAKVHEIANALHLNSHSQGGGKQRFMTLTKTPRSGVGVDEKKIRRILQTGVGSWGPENRKGGKATSLSKHREGEEVGKSAPKIGESNIGFQMLAAMGWSEGDRIGLSGGLDVPLKAIMKKTKLGLGAL